MKRIGLLQFLLVIFAMVPCLTACDHGFDPEDNLIVEPPMASFLIDKDGVPYRETTEQEMTERAKLITSEVIGYGWKWNETFEIDTNGAVIPTPYYQDLDGAGPSDYYIKSNTEIVKYFFFDAWPASCFKNMKVNIDENTGMIKNQGNCLMNIFDVFVVKGRYYISVIEPLGMRSDGKGGLRKIWAVSSYSRTTENELKEIQKFYNTDIDSLRWE